MQPTGWGRHADPWATDPGATDPYHPYLRQPVRPRYREPHPVRSGAVWSGVAVTVLWFLFFALVAWNARSYAWLALLAGACATAAAVALARYGDRGVAVGVASTSALGVGVAGLIVAAWYLVGDWVLW